MVKIPKDNKTDTEPQDNYLSKEIEGQGKSQNALAGDTLAHGSGNALARPASLPLSEIKLLGEEVEKAREAHKLIMSGYSILDSDLTKAREAQMGLKVRLEQGEKALEASVSEFVKGTEEHKQQVLREFSEGVQTALAAFSEQQAIREPVKLWAEKQKEHAFARKLSLSLFIFGLLVAAGAVVGLVYFLATQAEYVEALLAPAGCDPADKASNCAGFSLKGTLLAAGVLTLFTLLLWFVRLQMKLYLAERHLALDARERQAFAQSYIGLVREGDVSEEAKEQRALVYAALFRPASDGTVKEEGGLDPSVAAAVSKVLMR